MKLHKHFSKKRSSKGSGSTPAQLNTFSFYHSDRHLNHTASAQPSTQISKQAKVPQRGRAAIWLVAILVLAVLYVIWGPSDNQTATTKQPAVEQAQTSPRTKNKPAYSLSQASSLWVVVNKLRPLNPKLYSPAHLVVPNIPLRSNITSTEKYVSATMAGPLEKMVNAAARQGVSLNLQSGYRSYNFQVSLYSQYVNEQGRASADEQSARPGYSEHQTGLAADLGSPITENCEVAQCFGTTTAGKWLAANSYKYGFIIRYPKGKQQITGYIYEPWHVRYVGTTLATDMHKKGVTTLEEYFGLPAAPDY